MAAKIHKVSIVIPVYNGEKSIGLLVDELISKLEDLYSLEIVLVNDCSPDNSEDVCIELARKQPEIVCFYSLAINVGEHNAVMAGLNKCTGECAVIMDDDFQNSVSEVIKLVDYMLNNNYDVIYTYYKTKHHSRFRNMGSRFNNWVATFMLNKPSDLYLSSFKILNRFLIDEVIKYNLPFPYIDGLILRTTSNIGKIEVNHDKRLIGKSNYTLRKLISLWLNMFTNFSIMPLRIFFILGMLFCSIGFGLSAYIVFEKIFNPSMPVGYTLEVVLIAIFNGVELIAIGVVGEYLGRVFMSSNRKPQYTIRKSFIKKSNNE